MWLNPHTHTHHCTQFSKIQFLPGSNEACNVLPYLGSAAITLDAVNVLCAHISVAELTKPGGGGSNDA